MSGLYENTMEEARGLNAPNTDIDNVAIVMGCSTAGNTLSPFFLSGSSAAAALGYGDAVDSTCQIIEQQSDDGNSVKFPCALYTVPSTNVGTYGAVDSSGVTGNVVVTMDANSHPYGTYQPYVRFLTGGIVGVDDGKQYVWSLDDGRTISDITDLGTDTSITIPGSNAKFLLNPTSTNLTALNTLIDDIFTELNAHVIDVTSAIHGGADTADEVNGTTYPAATNTATRVARINACRAAYGLHRVKTAGGVHGAPDNTNPITAPVATDDSSALILALDMKVNINAHESLVSTVHGSADSTNQITATDPAVGAIAIGDTARTHAYAPQPGTSDIDTAFTALAAASTQFTILVCDFIADNTMLSHIKSGRAKLLAAGKRVAVAVRVRDLNYEHSPNPETDGEWTTAVPDAIDSFTDSCDAAVAAYGLVTDVMTGRQYLRNPLSLFVANSLRVGRANIPNAPCDKPIPGFKLVDSTGKLVGHDEGPRGQSTGLSNASLGSRGRFVSTQRLADMNHSEDVYFTVPWVLYQTDERIRNWPTRRIANAIERETVTAGNKIPGLRVGYNKATQNTPATLTRRGLLLIHNTLFDAVGPFDGEIDNAKDASLDTGIIQVNPAVSVSNGNILAVDYTIAASVQGYVTKLSGTLSIQL